MVVLLWPNWLMRWIKIVAVTCWTVLSACLWSSAIICFQSSLAGILSSGAALFLRHILLPFASPWILLYNLFLRNARNFLFCFTHITYSVYIFTIIITITVDTCSWISPSLYLYGHLSLFFSLPWEIWKLKSNSLNYSTDSSWTTSISE